jgi:hypothetical protein
MDVQVSLFFAYFDHFDSFGYVLMDGVAGS